MRERHEMSTPPSTTSATPTSRFGWNVTSLVRRRMNTRRRMCEDAVFLESNWIDANLMEVWKKNHGHGARHGRARDGRHLRVEGKGRRLGVLGRVDVVSRATSRALPHLPHGARRRGGERGGGARGADVEGQSRHRRGRGAPGAPLHAVPAVRAPAPAPVSAAATPRGQGRQGGVCGHDGVHAVFAGLDGTGVNALGIFCTHLFSVLSFKMVWLAERRAHALTQRSGELSGDFSKNFATVLLLGAIKEYPKSAVLLGSSLLVMLKAKGTSLEAAIGCDETPTIMVVFQKQFDSLNFLDAEAIKNGTKSFVITKLLQTLPYAAPDSTITAGIASKFKVKQLANGELVNPRVRLNSQQGSYKFVTAYSRFFHSVLACENDGYSLDEDLQDEIASGTAVWIAIAVNHAIIIIYGKQRQRWYSIGFGYSKSRPAWDDPSTWESLDRLHIHNAGLYSPDHIFDPIYSYAIVDCGTLTSQSAERLEFWASNVVRRRGNTYQLNPNSVWYSEVCIPRAGDTMHNCASFMQSIFPESINCGEISKPWDCKTKTSYVSVYDRLHTLLEPSMVSLVNREV